MSVGDRFKRAADYGRRVADALGQRPTSVAVTLETWSAAVGTDGASVLTSTTTTLSPAPKVTPAGLAPSAFGGGLFDGRTLGIDAAEFEIGPITPAFPGGGYDAATQLAPALANARQRVYVTLAGRGFDAGGERFEIAQVDDTRPQSIRLRVRRTKQT